MMISRVSDAERVRYVLVSDEEDNGDPCDIRPCYVAYYEHEHTGSFGDCEPVASFTFTSWTIAREMLHDLRIEQMRELLDRLTFYSVFPRGLPAQAVEDFTDIAPVFLAQFESEPEAYRWLFTSERSFGSFEDPVDAAYTLGFLYGVLASLGQTNVEPLLAFRMFEIAVSLNLHKDACV